MRNLRSYCNGFCLLLLTLCFALTGTSVAVNQYYIAPTGSDSNDGSAAHPWRTINHADAALTLGPSGACTGTSGLGGATSGYGACVHVANGTYSGSITTSHSGTANQRIRYVCDTQYGCKVTGGGSSVIWSNHSVFTDVFGFEFDGSVNSIENGLVFYADGGQSWAFGNKFHDMCPGGGCSSGSVLEAANVTSCAAASNRYESNLLYHNNGGGSSTFISGNADGGISTQWCDIVRNNIVMDQGGGACIGITHTSTNNIVTNNTVLNCPYGGILVGSFTSPPGGGNPGGLNDFSTFTNNVIVNSGAVGHNGGLRNYSTQGCGPHNIYANNLMYGNVGGNYVNDTPCSVTPTGTQSGSNSTTFVNYTGTISGDYHLRTGSSAIGAGTPVCAISGCVPAIDFTGNARLQPLDIGSYAFAVTGAPGAPTGLTASVQ